MSRIALVASLAMLTTRGSLPLADRPAPRQIAEPETFPLRPVVPALTGTRPILWRPDLQEGNPFGFIPTDWTARPQLLPLTWEVQTVFASPSRDR